VFLVDSCLFVSGDLSEFFLSAFKYSITFSVSNLFRMFDLLWKSSTESHKNGLQNLIFASFIFLYFYYLWWKIRYHKQVFFRSDIVQS